MNGDFETWDNAGCPFNEAPTGWQNWSTSLGPDQSGTACMLGINSQSGQNHMNLVWINSGLREGVQQQLMGMNMGSTYRLSFWAAENDALYSGGGSCIVDLYVSQALVLTTPEITPGGQWTQYTYEWEATSSVDFIGIKVEPGTSGTSGSVGIDNLTITELVSVEEGLLSSFDVYPNPASDQVNVMLNEFVTDAQLEILDLTGKVVQRETTSFNAQSTVLDVSQLNAGVYFVRLSTEDATATKKLIVH